MERFSPVLLLLSVLTFGCGKADQDRDRDSGDRCEARGDGDGDGDGDNYGGYSGGEPDICPDEEPCTAEARIAWNPLLPPGEYEVEIVIDGKLFRCHASFTELGMVGRECDVQPSMLRFASPELFTINSTAPVISMKITRDDIVVFDETIERFRVVTSDHCTYKQCVTDNLVYSTR